MAMSARPSEVDVDYPDPTEIKKERDVGPKRSHIYKLFKKVVILAVCCSTLTINVSLMSEVSC